MTDHDDLELATLLGRAGFTQPEDEGVRDILILGDMASLVELELRAMSRNLQIRVENTFLEFQRTVIPETYTTRDVSILTDAMSSIWKRRIDFVEPRWMFHTPEGATCASVRPEDVAKRRAKNKAARAQRRKGRRRRTCWR